MQVTVEETALHSVDRSPVLLYDDSRRRLEGECHCPSDTSLRALVAKYCLT